MIGIDVKILTAQAFNVIDPTCFFSLHDKYYLGVSCSNRDWFYGQTYASFLLELKPDPYRPKSLAFLLKNGNSGIQPDSGSASRSTYFARASELRITNGSISRNFEVLSRAGREDRGHVVCGPCINLPPGKYLSRVQYAGNGSNSQEIGSYIVYRNADQAILAEWPLRGTENMLAIAELEFEITSKEHGRGIESRVDSRGIVDLRVTDLAIVRL